MIKPAKILVVNPNTTQSVTDRFVDEARRCAPAGVVIDGVTGTFGAGIVSTQAENVVAAHSALALLAAHGSAYDAAILAISFDSGLAAAQELMPIGTVGITQAAIKTACQSAEKIGLVVFGNISLPLYHALIRDYDMSDRIAAIETIDIRSSNDYLNEIGQDALVISAVSRLTDEHGAQACVICGAAIVGLARRIQPHFTIPVLDGAAPSVTLALSVVSAGKPSLPAPTPLSQSIGLSPELAALIAGNWPLPGTEMRNASHINVKE
ncbi:aspartate/glutamate racemase family protein [Rhizobium leguminosarum]|uniref:aspartate/glutamate racemase family protein n=1 Tax=Rhizobium leguminosarum TaxID=384 RepID=UPI003F9E985C